jgi:hypothetical protein
VAGGLAVTTANIKLYMKDRDFRESVRAKAESAAKPKAEPKKPDTSTGSADKNKPPAAVTPAGPAGNSTVGKAINLRRQAVQMEDTPKYRPLDYSQFVSAYSAAADRLLANDLSPSSFFSTAGEIDGAAAITQRTCLDNSNEGQARECRGAYDGYQASARNIRENLDALAGKVNDEVGGIKKKLLEAETPKQAYDRLAKELAPAYLKERDYIDACSFDIQYLTSEKADSKISGCASAIGAYTTLANQMEAEANKFRDAIKKYEDAFRSGYNAYSEAFNKNYALANYAQLTFYDFKPQMDAIGSAENLLDSSDSFFGQGKLNSELRNIRTFTERNVKNKEQLELNKAFLQSQTPKAAAVENAYTFSLKNGDAVDLRKFAWWEYYKTNFRGLVSDFLQGALGLLSPSTKGYTPDEHINYNGGSLRVWDSSKYPFYTTVAGHEAKLKELKDKTDVVREMKLEDRQKLLASAIAEAKPMFDKIEWRTTDVSALYRVFEDAAKVRDTLAYAVEPKEFFKLYYGEEASLSQKTLGDLQASYETFIKQARDREQKAIAAFKRFETEDYKDVQGNYKQDYMDARVEMNCKKWQCSDALWQAYKKMDEAVNSRWQAENQKFSPVKSMTVNGRGVKSDSSETLEFADKDLTGGEIVIKGELHPNTLGFVSDLKLTLDGQNYDRSLGAAQTFSYAFKPRAGQTYYLGVKPTLADGKRANAYPDSEHYFAVTYTNAGAAQIREFYDRFKAAYESRNAAQVMSLIAGSWTAGDGTTASDLEENLRNNFRLYDEIKFDLSNLEISKSAGGSRACYNVAITSRIFKRNLKHEEKSGVCEELGADEAGKIRITGNFSGNYWYMK